MDASAAKNLGLEDCAARSGPVGAVIRKLQSASVEPHLKDITSDVGITTIAAAIDDEASQDAALLSLGVGTHLVPEIAVLRALTEAVQSRLTTIHGTREDTFKAEYVRRIGYDRMKRINRKWFSPSQGTVRFADSPHIKATISLTTSSSRSPAEEGRSIRDRGSRPDKGRRRDTGSARHFARA